jgi:hypothetical protein
VCARESVCVCKQSIFAGTQNNIHIHTNTCTYADGLLGSFNSFLILFLYFACTSFLLCLDIFCARVCARVRACAHISAIPTRFANILVMSSPVCCCDPYRKIERVWGWQSPQASPWSWEDPSIALLLPSRSAAAAHSDLHVC